MWPRAVLFELPEVKSHLFPQSFMDWYAVRQSMTHTQLVSHAIHATFMALFIESRPLITQALLLSVHPTGQQPAIRTQPMLFG